MEETTVSPAMFNIRSIKVQQHPHFLADLFVLLNKPIEPRFTILDYLSPSIALHLYSPTQILVLNMTFHPHTLPDLKGKVFIVTGGNSGM